MRNRYIGVYVPGPRAVSLDWSRMTITRVGSRYCREIRFIDGSVEGPYQIHRDYLGLVLYRLDRGLVARLPKSLQLPEWF